MKVGNTVTTEAELRSLPFGTQFLGANGAPWEFGAPHWNADQLERHLVRGLLRNLPLKVTYIPHPAELTHPELLAEAHRITNLYGYAQRNAILDLLVALDATRTETGAA